MDKLELSCNFFSNQTFWISHMWWEPTNQSFPSLAGGSSLTIDFSFSFFVEFHLKRHHLMTMTNLFTSQSKASFGNKSVQKGTSGDEYLALSTEVSTKKPLISWFNEHGHPAHHHSFFSVLDYWGSGKMTYFRAFKHIRERRFLKSKYNLLVDKIKWCLL